MSSTSAVVSRSVAAPRRELPAFNLVLLHDHELAAKAAQQTIRRLLSYPLHQTEVHQDHWTFDELIHPQFHDDALEMARSCDLMLVATVANGSLPFHVRSWIRDWSENRCQKEAAFLFLSRFRDALIDASVQLAELEASDNLAVFTGSLLLPESASIPGRRVVAPARYSPRPERWGLNE